MQLLSILVLFVVGVSVIQLLCSNLRLLAKFGFALPIGMGISSLLMFLMDLFGLHFNVLSNLLLVHLAFIAITATTLVKNQDLLTKLQEEAAEWKILPINLAWLILILIIAGIGYGVISRALFWPVFIYDSVTAYDLIARVAATEGMLNNSVFDHQNLLTNVRTSYPPGLPLNLCLAHVVGFDNPKIISALFFCSMVIAFYALVKEQLTHFGAAAVTLFLVLTPEYAAFSSTSSNNPPAAFFNGLGLISIYLGTLKRGTTFYDLGIVLLCMGVWYRPESVFFVLGGVILFLIDDRTWKDWSRPVILGLCSLSLFVAWQLYLKFELEVGNGATLGDFSLNIDRLSEMGSQLFETSLSATFYGAIIYVFLATIVVNGIYKTSKEKHTRFLMSISIIWLSYVMLFYFLEIDFQVTWITSGYKRGLFSFLPPMLYYVAMSPIVKKIFNKYLAIVPNLGSSEEQMNH